MFSILTTLFFSTYTCITIKLGFVNWRGIVYLWNMDFWFCWGLWQLPFFFFSTLMDLFKSSLSSRYSRSRFLLVSLTYSIFSSFSPFLYSQFRGPDLADICLPIPGKENLADWPSSEVFAFGPTSEWSGENHVIQLAHRCDLCGSGRKRVLKQGGY